MLVLFNKPYDVLCQFTDELSRPSLADFIGIKDVYPAGRLDRDSEGLVVLTDNPSVQHFLSHPRFKVAKTYWVQVEGIIDQSAISILKQGVKLKDGPTLPCHAQEMPAPTNLWPRTPPIRKRKNIPTSWLSITLKEGKNRQVRRMTAHVGFPTLRLIRHSLGDLNLQGISPGDTKVIDDENTLDFLSSVPKKKRHTLRQAKTKIAPKWSKRRVNNKKHPPHSSRDR